MKKYSKTILNLIIICLLTIYSNRLVAQQSKVDSAIVFLNKSISTDKLDTSSVGKAVGLLVTASLTDSQIEQIETAADKIKYWSPFLSPFGIRYVVFISETDVGKKITYAKLQIEKLDKFKTIEAAGIRSIFLINLGFSLPGGK